MTADARTAALVAELRRRDQQVKKIAEHAAPSYAGGRWRAYREGGTDGHAIESADGRVGFIVGDRSVANHIAANDPQAVLDEIEGRRRIYDGWEHLERLLTDTDAPPDGWVRNELLSVRRAWRLAVEALAYRWRHELDPVLLPVWED